ncbi:MAG: DNA repair protein RecN [Bacteroidales bacterium]|jgi:DNA repair protein RecN (Recombination protein N)|nr:DNA repair protein RecN [Bacteroidales bacterium]
MLQHLSIKNYTLIKELSIDFKEGFSVITGETGAGKSILLGALALLTGQRADTSVLLDKTKKSIIEADFHIKNYGLQDFFAENDIDYDEQCIIRREITPQEKSRAFINDTPVSVTVLRKIGEILLDIHAQNTNLLLQNKDFQLLLIDQFANLQAEIANYHAHFKRYTALQKEYRQLYENSSMQDRDYWEFLYKELEDFHLQSGEQQKLEEELEVLSNAEEIKQNLYAVNCQLQEGETNVLSVLFDSLNRLQVIAKYKQSIQELTERLQSQIVDLKDIAFEIDKLQEKTIYDPQQIEIINLRLDALYSLQQKHKVNTEAELISIREHIARQLQLIDDSEENKQKLQKAIEKAKCQLLQLGQALSAKRQNVLPKMESDLKKVLQLMNMPNASIQLRMQQSENLYERGLDTVVFWFTANPGVAMQAVDKIASGGELSRLMLAIKSLISQKNILPSIIFDEIDSGVSGEVSAKMGKVMQNIASYSQVIAITHVPQIAAAGSQHYLVYKESDASQTVSDIKQLNQEERIIEIAKMISNEKLTDTAIDAAKQLLLP